MVANFVFFELDDLLGPGPHLPGPIGRSRTMPVNSPEINRFPETQIPPEVEESDGDIVFTQYNPEYGPQYPFTSYITVRFLIYLRIQEKDHISSM